MPKVLLVVIVAIVVAGCGGGTHQGIPVIPIGDLQAAPEQVEIGGTECIVSPRSQLTRDFFPGGLTPPDGGPLAAWVQIEVSAGQTAPPDIKLRYLYVIKGTEVWQTELSRWGVSTSDGPKWETGTLVDMVVLVCQGGNSYLIKASDVPIWRLD